jgi:hypothetical protein
VGGLRRSNELNFRDDFFEGIDPLHSCQRSYLRVRFGLVQQSVALSSLLFAARFDRGWAVLGVI